MIRTIWTVNFVKKNFTDFCGKIKILIERGFDSVPMGIDFLIICYSIIQTHNTNKTLFYVVVVSGRLSRLVFFVCVE